MQVYPVDFVYKKLPHFLKNCAFPLGKSLNASIQKGLGDLIIKFRGNFKKLSAWLLALIVVYYRLINLNQPL